MIASTTNTKYSDRVAVVLSTNANVPLFLTREHSASSYGIPVLLWDDGKNIPYEGEPETVIAWDADPTGMVKSFNASVITNA